MAYWRLDDGSGACADFAIFDLPTEGTRIGPTRTNVLGITNGLFSAGLHFGASVFNGDVRWLDIALRPNGSDVFTPLLPRQLLQPNPYALFAPVAGSAMMRRV